MNIHKHEAFFAEHGATCQAITSAMADDRPPTWSAAELRVHWIKPTPTDADAARFTIDLLNPDTDVDYHPSPQIASTVDRLDACRTTYRQSWSTATFVIRQNATKAWEVKADFA